MGGSFFAFIGSFVSVLVLSGLFASASYAGGGQIGCSVEIIKRAVETPTIFEFSVIPSVGNEFTLPVASNDDNGFGLNFGQSATISEIVPEGWVLTNIECSSEGGAVVTWEASLNEVFVLCQTEGIAICDFTNRPLNSIPTLSEWGMIGAAAVLALVGVFFAARRRKAQAV